MTQPNPATPPAGDPAQKIDPAKADPTPVPPAQPNPTAGADAGKQQGEPKFTQEQLNSLVGKAREDGRSAASSALLKELDVKSLDEVKAALKALEDAKKAQMTDAERLKTEKDQAEAKVKDAESRAQAAENDRKQALLEVAVVRAAADRFANPEAVLKLIDAAALKFENGKWVGVQEALDKLATDEPWTLKPAASTANADAQKTKTKIGLTNQQAKKTGDSDEDNRARFFGNRNKGFFETRPDGVQHANK